MRENHLAEIIDLGLQLGNQSLAVLIIVVPQSDRQVGIVIVQVHPTGRENYPPPNIQLSLLSESGATLRSVQSRHQDNYIQLKRCRGSTRECFNIQVGCADGVTEKSIVQSLY